MWRIHILVLVGALLLVQTVCAQNCCSPAVPPQGVLGETVALPHILQISFYHEYLRGRDYNVSDSEATLYYGSASSDWNRTSLALSYGISRRISASAVVPFVWKKKVLESERLGTSVESKSHGFGDVTTMIRFSLLPRDFVNFREVSIGLGVKIPTGSTHQRSYGYRLPYELQPGTGSWDYLGALTVYKGFELVDFLASVTYVLTGKAGERESAYEFGNQFYYLFDTNWHLASGVDFSLALSGAVRRHDEEGGWEPVEATKRHQMWLVPGVELMVIPGLLGLQVHFEHPIYQDLDGIQLKSDYNLRANFTYMLQLSGKEEEDY
jgi:hypothetical protein